MLVVIDSNFVRSRFCGYQYKLGRSKRISWRGPPVCNRLLGGRPRLPQSTGTLSEYCLLLLADVWGVLRFFGNIFVQSEEVARKSTEIAAIAVTRGMNAEIRVEAAGQPAPQLACEQ